MQTTQTTIKGKTQKVTAVEEQENDRLTIQRAYRALLQTIKDAMDEEDQHNVRLAFDMALEAHDGQRRKSGDPYILHPIEVARICVEEIGLGPTAVICALLHDVVEDTPVTLDDIRAQFGERGMHIAAIVDGLTKLDRNQNAKEKQAANFRKVLTTLTTDVRVVLIKMADRLHNMRTLGAMPHHKQLRIASETSFIYAPLAHRLGLYAIKTEFEDLSMKITDSENYRYIARKLNETKRSREAYVEKFIAPIKRELDELPELKGRYRIFGRPKSIYSISNKIKKKNVAFEQIYDLFAIRIIVDIPKEKLAAELSREEQALVRKRHDQKVKLICWSVYSIVTDIYRPIPKRLKDWINRPKANGYESLHTTVVGLDGRFVEIQIRDERMDAVAERGFAAHWKYKNNASEPDVYSIWLDSVRDVLNDPNSSPTEFLQDFKSGLFQDEVYVFTPEGDMKILPKGATALDFAFSVHTDLGYHCSSLMVNNKIVPLGYRLENGDQIEIFTNSKQKPSESWINSVITSKAKSKIRSAMKEERRKVGALGKERLERKLKNLKVDFDKGIEFLVDFLGYKSHLDLYYDIATEARTVPSIFKEIMVDQGKLMPKLPTPEKAMIDSERPINDTSKPRKTSKLGLFINDEPAELYQYQLASCCNPVQGDSIFAYITVSSELKVHRTNCSNAPHMMASHGHRVMKAEWATTGEHTFVADLKITGWDNGKGVIQRISNEISSTLGINIRSFTMSGNEGVFEGEVSLLVANKDQLYLAIKALKKLDNVSTVIRVK
ncbi:MAG: HD domain-containing protein [Bacteroidota bacterium]